MEALVDKIDINLFEAVLIWTGRKSSVFPCRDDNAVIEKYGSELASLLLERLSQLKHEFYLSDAKFTASNLEEMANESIANFKKRYPNLDERIAETFSWCYTYDFK
jgi:hypothetical protein